VFHIEVADNNQVDLGALSLVIVEPEERVIFNGENIFDRTVITGSGQHYVINFRLDFEPLPEILYRMVLTVADTGGNTITDEFTVTFLRNLPAFNRSVSVYDYDLGRSGIVEDLNFNASGLAKFRVKITETVDELETIDYDGLTNEQFDGDELDPDFWRTISTTYNIVQASSVLTMSGTRIGLSGVWGAPAEIQSIWPIGYSFDASVDIKLQNLVETTGAMAFLAIEDGASRIEVQKFYKEIAHHVDDALAVDENGNIGQSVIVGESAELFINNVLRPDIDVSGLTSGDAGQIDTDTIFPKQIDTIPNLKQRVNLNGVIDELVLDNDFARVFKVHEESSIEISASKATLTYILDQNQGLGQVARLSVTGPVIDLSRQQVASLNLYTATGEYAVAEVNDQWTTTALLPLGTYKYKYWVDGEEIPDPNNLDRGTDAVGEYSILELEAATQVTFVLNVKAEEVSVVGDFNQYDPLAHPMTVGTNLSAVSQMFSFGNSAYINDHRDFHKVEIVFDRPTTISHVLFETGVTQEDLQRVRILLDDIPIHKSDWTVTSEDAMRTEFFDNSTDVFVSADDGLFKWEPNEDIAQQRYSKFTLVTRLENGVNFTRQHEYLEIRAGLDVSDLVADYDILNQRTSIFSVIRSTTVDAQGDFAISDVALEEGENTLTLFASDDESTVEGETAVVDVSQPKSIIRRLDQSGFTTGKLESVFGASRNLTKPHSVVLSIVDDSSLNPSHIPDEGESTEPIEYQLSTQDDFILGQILRPVYDARLFGGILGIDVPVGSTTTIDIEKTFDLLGEDKVRVEQQTYSIIGARFFHTFLSYPAIIVDIEELPTYYHITIDREFIPPTIVEPGLYGYGIEDMPFGWVIELTNRIELITDYVIHPDGQVDCINESGLATGEVQIEYRTTGVFVSTASEDMTSIPTTPNDLVRIVIEPIDNRITLSEFHHMDITFFGDSDTVFMPTQVQFRINDIYEYAHDRPRLVEEVTADDGVPDRLMLFEAFKGDMFGLTQFPSEYNEEDNPTIDKIEMEFVSPSTELKISNLRVVGVSVARNTVMRVVVNDREVFTLDESINPGRFDQFKISAERDAFEVFFNDVSYYRRSLTFDLPKVSLGVRAHQNGDTVTAVFDNFQATRYFDRNPIILRLKGRYLRTEATLVDDEVN